MPLPPVPPLETARLRLRGWREADLAPLAAMNADAEVMRHLGGPIGRRESDLILGRFLEKWAEEPRFGWWAVERRADGAFAGFVGLGCPDFEGPPAPCVEIGWRLARGMWGQGLATEAAQACLRHGFRTVGLPEILSFTVPANAASRRVMERLGMRRDAAADFDHPLVAAGSPLRRHVLYRIGRRDWEAARRGG
jgi:ribosomal-protein-alanine N-acetyltransferase